MVVDQQVGRRRRRGLPRRQGRQGQPAQDRHHAVEPVHHAAGDRRALQLEGPDAGRDDGARRVRAVGQRRDAVQDARRTTSTRSRRRPRQVQDGRHRLQAGRPDHHRRAREGDRREVHLRALQGRRRGRGPAGRQAHRFDGQQPDRGGGAMARRARCARCACSTSKRMPYNDKVAGDMSWGDIPTCKSQGLDVEYLMLRGIFMPAGVHQGAGRLLRRPAQEGARDAGVEGAHARRRVQPRPS